MSRLLTRDKFKDLKSNFPVYGTHTEIDSHRNKYRVKNDTKKTDINVMFQPLTDDVALAEYGTDISKMYYCIVYDDVDIEYNDIIPIRDDDYEVVGLKYFNTYTRIDVKKKVK